MRLWSGLARPAVTSRLTGAAGSASREIMGHWMAVGKKSQFLFKRLLEYPHDITTGFSQNELAKSSQVRSLTVFFWPRLLHYIPVFPQYPRGFTGRLYPVLQETLGKHVYQEAGITEGILEAGSHIIFAFWKQDMSHVGMLPQSIYWLTWKTASFEWILQ